MISTKINVFDAQKNKTLDTITDSQGNSLEGTKRVTSELKKTNKHLEHSFKMIGERSATEIGYINIPAKLSATESLPVLRSTSALKRKGNKAIRKYLINPSKVTTIGSQVSIK